ncbi:YcaO-related McrA-glycine thioamidation protein [Methanosphaera cuniculi]|uniref:YcaO-related McrA-glycine thioamidation protein n=1 Tax=Methanosphaera cuniculi TaxID=1077256 RepID=UPI0026DCA66B|nr:YcaO-related McrA-glycine thioamidation protein [Methanosphaera cuniculi]
MLNESQIKYKKSTHRTQSPEDTLRNIEKIIKDIGLTRTSNITHLDRIKIPVFTSVRPMAEEGAVSVYAGKGPNETHAKVSSIMEAIERYSAEIQDSDKFINQKYNPETSLDPESLILPKNIYHDDTLEWTKGYSIKTGAEILIPANAVYHPYNSSDVKHLFYSNTNGLASGNTIEEAIFHGMMEVIERDAWSLFEAFRKVKPEIICDNTQNEYIQELLKKFSDANVSIKLIDLTSDNQIPTIGAVSEDLTLKDPALLTLGIGTHLDPTIAAIRAITEVAQSRATQIHGTREDTTRANLLRNAGYDRMKRLNKHWFMQSDKQINLEDMPNMSHDTFRENIEFTMKQLEKSDVNDAYYVDLTRDIKIPVVRVIIPGMELYSVDTMRIGERLRPENGFY